MNNTQSIMKMFNMYQQNPMRILSMRFNIPQEMNNPNDIIQHLLNTGQVTQSQVNQAMQMRNNPNVLNLFNLK